jgi:hypothetical protein
MWWADRVGKPGQAIQDRWCADPSQDGSVLNPSAPGSPVAETNADGDPTAKEAFLSF